MASIEFDLHTQNESEILKGILDKRRSIQPIEYDSLGGFWGELSYGLSRSKLYGSFDQTKREEILSNLAFSRIEEAYHIENAGMTYTAKMTLLSDTLEERELYSHFSEDEARHLSYLRRVIPDFGTGDQPDSFVSLLQHVIRDGRKRPLIFIIQVLLEGWGIEHYTKMAKECQNREFSTLLQQIVRDEAGHHGSGLLLFDEKELTQSEINYILEILVEFFHMVQMGPVNILRSFEHVTEGLTKKQKLQLYNDLNAENESNRKIQTLKKLMHKSSSNHLIEKLERKGLLKAYSNEKSIDLLS